MGEGRGIETYKGKTNAQDIFEWFMKRSDLKFFKVTCDELKAAMQTRRAVIVQFGSMSANFLKASRDNRFELTHSFYSV